MSLGATLLASFLVTLGRPATWPLALATFLIRGGLLVVVAPIVVIPSAVGLANVVAPLLTSFVFGGVSAGFLALVVGAVLAVVAWATVAGLVAAAAEAEGAWIVATDDDIVATCGRPPGDRDGAPPSAARRILAARLVAHLPTSIALTWGASRIVAVTYRELTLPSDVVSPLVVRVARDAPDAIAVILVTWILGEVVGSLAARRITLHGDGVSAALRSALGSVLRHPLRVAALAGLPLAALVAVIVPVVAAAGVAWDAVRDAIAVGGAFVETFLFLIVFVASWVGGLLLLAVVSAWRAAAWSVDSAGTFGAMAPVRQGDWNDTMDSGTLTDLRPRGVDPDRGDR